MTGTLYGVGIGPGDPELMTLKAVRILQECDLIAAPQTGKDRQVALQIATQILPELADKEQLALPFPMTKNQEELDRNRDRIAGMIAAHLIAGKTVAFLTLGDPSVYATYWYIHRRIVEQNLPAEMIPGVPSFCAAAAKLNTALAEASQPIHILPASYPETREALALPGTKVLMKMGSQLPAVVELLREMGCDKQAALVQNCGLENERICTDMENITDTSYFSIIVVKEDMA